MAQFEIDGCTSHIEISTDSLLTEIKEFSLCMWIRVDSLKKQIISSFGDTQISVENGQLGFKIKNTPIDVRSYTKIELGKWQHICIKYGKELEFYLNGKKINQYFVDHINTKAFNIDRINLGCDELKENFFSGAIHGFMVFDRILDEEQSKALYNRELFPKSFDNQHPNCVLSIPMTQEFKKEETKVEYGDDSIWNL